MRKIVGGLGLVALALGLWVVARSQQAHHPAARHALEPVRAHVLHWTTFDQWVDALGTATSPRVVTVHVQLDGQPLIRLNVHEGDFVHRGQLLAQIDPRPYQIQLEQAQAQMQRDQQLLDNARVDQARYERLLKQRSVSDQVSKTQDAQVKADAATVATDQAQLDNARLQLSYTQITSPMDGVVGLRQVDPGNLVHITDPNGLMTITCMDPMDILFSIPQDDWMLLQSSGTHPQVEVWNRDQTAKLVDGAVLSHDNQIDPASGTLRLRAEVSNHAQTLLHNAFVVVRLRLRHLEHVHVVPEQALLPHAAQTLLDLVVHERIEQKPVHVLARNGEQAWIAADDVADGALYVAEGTDRLEAGMRVRLSVDPQP